MGGLKAFLSQKFAKENIKLFTVTFLPFLALNLGEDFFGGRSSSYRATFCYFVTFCHISNLGMG